MKDLAKDILKLVANTLLCFVVFILFFAGIPALVFYAAKFNIFAGIAVMLLVFAVGLKIAGRIK